MNHTRLQHFYMILHVKCCSLMWFNSRPNVTLYCGRTQNHSTNDQVIQSNVVPPYVTPLYLDFSTRKIKIPNHRGLSSIWTVIIPSINLFLRWSWCFWQCFTFKFFITEIKSNRLMKWFSKNLFSSFFILCSREWISAWYWWCWCFA